MIVKTCSKCKQVKPVSEFDKRKDSKDGYRGQCHECRRVMKLKYAADHREQEAQRAKEWYHSNIDRGRAARKAYYLEHRQEVISRATQYRADHPNERKSYIERWNAENAVKIRGYREKWESAHPGHKQMRCRKRRAIKSETYIDLTSEQWEEVLDRYDHRCLACGAADDITLDHVIPVAMNGPTTMSNVQPLCGICNSAKGVKIIDYRPEWWTDAT